MPDAEDTFVYALDDGWWYQPKHVEQFPDKINCVTLHLVGCILEYRVFLIAGLLAVGQTTSLVPNLPCSVRRQKISVFTRMQQNIKSQLTAVL
jgi:hypothetical protein